MKKRILIVLVILFLLPGFCIPGKSAQLPWVIDNAELLTQQEENALSSGISQLKTAYGFDIVIVTVDSLNGQYPQDYADYFYTSHGYGDNGVLFLLSMAERDWYISTCGEAIYALTDYGIQKISTLVVPYLSDGDYCQAFTQFLNVLPSYFDAYNAGTPIDGYADYSGDYYHGEQEEIYYYQEPYTPSFPLSLVIGMVIGLISILVMRSSMNTKHRQRGAAEYLKDHTYRLYGHQDLFLYSNVAKVRKQQNSSGGGSSVHRGGGGRSHGGGGGKF